MLYCCRGSITSVPDRESVAGVSLGGPVPAGCHAQRSVHRDADRLLGFDRRTCSASSPSSACGGASSLSSTASPRPERRRSFKLPLLWLDWSGARVASIDTLTVGDYDERDRRVRLRASTTKTRAALWVELPDVLANAFEASLPPREDRDGAAPLFPGVSADRLRTAIARACRAAGVPVFSPHDLRHRRSACCIGRVARGPRSPASSVSGSSRLRRHVYARAFRRSRTRLQGTRTDREPGYTQGVKAVWQGRMAQTAAKYGEHAPMAAVCCNACRTCATTNVLALGLAGVSGAAYGLARVGKRLIGRS